MHFISVDGTHYKSKTRGYDVLKPTGTVFPADVGSGFCGEFDGNDILAANFGDNGGIVRYSLSTSIVTLESNSNDSILWGHNDWSLS